MLGCGEEIPADVLAVTAEDPIVQAVYQYGGLGNRIADFDQGRITALHDEIRRVRFLSSRTVSVMIDSRKLRRAEARRSSSRPAGR